MKNIMQLKEMRARNLDKVLSKFKQVGNYKVNMTSEMMNVIQLQEDIEEGNVYNMSLYEAYKHSTNIARGGITKEIGAVRAESVTRNRDDFKVLFSQLLNGRKHFVTRRDLISGHVKLELVSGE